MVTVGVIDFVGSKSCYSAIEKCSIFVSYYYYYYWFFSIRRSRLVTWPSRWLNFSVRIAFWVKLGFFKG